MAESSDSISSFAGPFFDTGFKKRRMGHPPAKKAESAWSATFPPPDIDSPNSTSPLPSRPPWMGMASTDDGVEESVGSNLMQSTAAADDYYSYTPSAPNASHPFFFPDYTPSTPPLDPFSFPDYTPATPPPNSPFYTPAYTPSTPLLSPHCDDYCSYTPATPNASDPFSFPDYTPATPPPNSPFYTPATPPLSPHCDDYYSYTPSTPNASDPFSFPDYTPSTPPPNSPFYTPATPPLSPIFHTLSPFRLMGSH